MREPAALQRVGAALEDRVGHCCGSFDLFLVQHSQLPSSLAAVRKPHGIVQSRCGVFLGGAAGVLTDPSMVRSNLHRAREAINKAR
jgi:hypothetical protein